MIICPKCKQELEDDTKFCGFCGAKIEEESAEAVAEETAEAVEAPAEETIEETAARELREETGAVPRELIDLGDYYGSPAIMGERIRMFLARGLTFTDNDLDDDEFLEVFRMPLSDAVEAVLKGEIPDGKTQCGILRAAAMLK